MIGTFFIDLNQPPVAIGSMQHAQCISRLDERLHILPIRPRIYHPVFVFRETVYHTTEYFHTIYFQNDSMHSVTIAHSVHIIIGTNS